MEAYFNPLDKNTKSIIGAIETGKTLELKVLTSEPSCDLVIRKDYENDSKIYRMAKTDGGFSYNLTIDSEGLYFYYFSINSRFYIGLGEGHKGVITPCPKPFQLTVYKNGFTTPDFIKGGIIYQIFPDRFCKVNDYPLEKGKVFHNNWKDTPYFLPNEKGEILNNDFFGGNLQGIISKLNYLKSLNVTIIYLNPIFKAYSNHRYDTGDYMQIDTLLGSEADLKELIDKASALGIKIILDGVFNHTGADSKYFNKYGGYDEVGAYQSKKSQYADWYNFSAYPDKYDAWWGVKILPQVNENSSSYKEYILGKNGVIRHYTKLGVGGWRLDVADELPSDFVKGIRTAVKAENENAVIIGEVWEDASNKISYNERREYLLGQELDSVMNYPLKNAIIKYVKSGDAKELTTVIKEQIDHYPKVVLDGLMNILGTHDTVRIIDSLGGQEINGLSKQAQSELKLTSSERAQAKEKLKIAALIEYTVYGVPCVYYGDETGLEGYTDPLNRKTYPWGEEDYELIEYYKRLGEIRSKISAFKKGELTIVYSDKDALFYKREDEESSVFIAVNNSQREYFMYFDGEIYELITNKKYNGKVKISPKSSGIFYAEKI